VLTELLRGASRTIAPLALAACLTTPPHPREGAPSASGGGDRTQPRLRFERRSTDGLRWFKGNTHTHTLESDGDSPPEVVARWYKSHGYQFLVLSDHNVFVDPKTLSALVDSTFLLIPGEELTTSFQQRPVHVNGLNLPHVVAPRTDSTLVGTIQRNVDAVREVGAVPHINHPNFRWAFGARELLQVERDRLLEIFNGHPHVHNEGGGDAPGMEAVWDELLTAGKRIYGIAVDDAHSFTDFSPERSNPGRGWIVVRARALDAASLLGSMEDGLFYASTGVALDDVVVTDSSLAVHIARDRDFRYRTRFIGAEGRVLLETTANPAVYTLRGNEPYVRAKVIDSGGRVAWVQPVFTRS
jgi:hypothetical protein